ncbi:hypothetical protein ACFY3N_05585 [Streptomyces sp. NPDC000348]|uniref:hypothetical protein n=1 Tax=Streptomyces sp. NPDC000348 TaxID=3364538 RepID=UPI0036C8F38C
MPAHDEHRDPENAGNPGSTEYDGTEYDGMDALMAAILDEPLPGPARQDPEFLAARGAAVADLAVLREQLVVIGDALAAPAGEGVPAGAEDGAPAGRGGAARSGERPESGDGPGRTTGARSPGGALPGTGTGHPPAAPARLRALPSRGPHRARRRPLKVALGALAAAAAATVVVGTGWLVTQPGGVSDSAGGSAAAQADSKEAGGAAFGSPRYLACARLVAEGTVLAVDPVPEDGTERVTLGASRYYKGEGEVAFLRDPAGDPPLREGDHVLVGMPPDGVHPDTVIVGEADIAPERARITASLPESRTLACG